MPSPANQRRYEAAESPSPFESPGGLPDSRVVISARSSARWVTHSAAFSRSAARSEAVFAAQPGKAAWAASMAAATSSAPPNGTVSTTSSEPGSTSSQVPPPLASTHSPPMSMRRCGAPKSVSCMREALLPERALGRGDGLADDRERLVELCVRDGEGREEAQAVRVQAGADHDHAARERLLGDLEHELGPRGLGLVLDELDREHGPEPAHVADRGVPRGQVLEPRPEGVADLARPREEPLGSDLLERGQRGGAGQ